MLASVAVARKRASAVVAQLPAVGVPNRSVAGLVAAKVTVLSSVMAPGGACTTTSSICAAAPNAPMPTMPSLMPCLAPNLSMRAANVKLTLVVPCVSVTELPFTESSTT